MTAKTIFRIFTFSPSISRDRAASPEQAAQTASETPHDQPETAATTASGLTSVATCVQISIAENTAVQDHVLDEPEILPAVSPLEKTCRDCGSPLDSFGDCPRMDPRGREMEKAPRYCEPGVVHWRSPGGRGQGTRVQASVQRWSA